MKHARIAFRVLGLLFSLLFYGCGGGNGDNRERSAITPAMLPPTRVSLRQVVSGLSSPTFMTHAGDLRIFITEQPGRIRILHNGSLLATPFLDIRHLVRPGGERGLLSMAFHPNYGTPGAPGEGLFWVNYTNINGDTVIARYRVANDNPNLANPDSALILFTIAQPFSNHNGGQLQFGLVEGQEQKRYLYIGMGDGGSGGDPQNNGQRDDTLLGKMLRIDPSTDARPSPPFYTIPPDNPHAAAGILLGAIWAKGLRNPWRFSFDVQTGNLYIADVGQDLWEEVNVTPARTSGGLNYGWRITEGLHCFNPSRNCNMSGLALPVIEYGRSDNRSRCSVIGGYVYRGSRFPMLVGKYIYADFCSGEIFGLEEVSSGKWESTLLLSSGVMPLTFGEDVNQELYMGAADGNVYQIISVPNSPL